MTWQFPSRFYRAAGRQLGICLVPLLLLNAADGVSPATVQRAKRFTLPVVVGCADEQLQIQEPAVIGSGFYLDRNGRFLTANHVLDTAERTINSRNRPECFAAIYAPHGDWSDRAGPNAWFRFQITGCTRDRARDLASCTPLQNPFLDKQVAGSIDVAEIGRKAPVEGQPVAFTGFPIQFLRPLTSMAFVAQVSATENPDNSPELVLDKPTWGGVSGGPLYGADGRVIGLMVMNGTNDAAGLSLARGLPSIEAFLRTSRPASTDAKRTK